MNLSVETLRNSLRRFISDEYRTGILLLFLVSVFSSAGWVFTKIALKEFDPVAFIAWRFLLAAFILLPFCLHQLHRFTRQQWMNSIVAGLMLALAFVIWIEGMNQIEDIGEAAFIVSLSVVLVPLLSAFLGDKLGVCLWLSLIPALLGLYLLTGVDGFHLESAQILLLLAALIFSCHVIFSTRQTKFIPSLSLTTVQLFIVAIFAFLVSAQQGVINHVFEHSFSSLTWWMLICSAIIATSVRYGLLIKAMTMVSAHESSMLMSLTPVFTALLGWWILGENMSAIQLVGCGLIFLAQPVYRYGQR